jgi:hypothetical protein
MERRVSSVSSKRIRLAALAGAVVAAVGLVASTAATSARPQSGGPPDAYVAAWDTIGSQAFTAAAAPPADGTTIFAYVGIAVYDAVTAIEGGYRPFAVDVDAPEGASPEAAVAASAHRILVHYLPGQAATILDPAYVASLATIPDGQAKTDGIATGEQVAAELIAQRADDGFRIAVPYIAPDPPIPGVWIPTAPTPPVGTYLPRMRPFSLQTADQFRPSGPPDLSGDRWAQDYNEVKELGSRTSTARTAEQTLAARFWGEAPVQQAHAALRGFLLGHELDVADAARFMAMTSVVWADAQIACYEAKYHYAFWRPVTAIRAGDTDGNDTTVADPDWVQLLAVTPNHPEYPSAHACITPATGIVIERFLGTGRIDFTVPSLTGLGDRHFEFSKDLEDEVNEARIWGGLHYRASVEDGSTIARKTAHYVLAHNFHRIEP